MPQRQPSFVNGAIEELSTIDILDMDFDQILEVLPEPVKDAISKLREGYRVVKLFMGFIPKSYRGKIANLEGHNIVKAFKEAERLTGKNWDNLVVRTAIKNILIGMYELDEDWLPVWGLNPDDANNT